MQKPTLGDQELAVLRFIAEHAPVTGREVADKFADEQELARTTVLTKIERLRRKGFITRRRKNGVYLYSANVPQAELLLGLVREFVARTLGGSISPVVAYLLDSGRVSDDELQELERLARELREQRGSEAGHD